MKADTSPRWPMARARETGGGHTAVDQRDHAAIGVHAAHQDLVPMILMISMSGAICAAANFSEIDATSMFAQCPRACSSRDTNR